MTMPSEVVEHRIPTSTCLDCLCAECTNEHCPNWKCNKVAPPEINRLCRVPACLKSRVNSYPYQFVLFTEFAPGYRKIAGFHTIEVARHLQKMFRGTIYDIKGQEVK